MNDGVGKGTLREEKVHLKMRIIKTFYSKLTEIPDRSPSPSFSTPREETRR